MTTDRKICFCMGVTVQNIVDAMKDGADTVEKVGEKTGAGTACGRCKESIQEVIDQNK